MRFGSIDRIIDPLQWSRQEAPPVLPPSDPDANITGPGRLDHGPERVLAPSLRNRKRWILAAAAGTLVVHGGFAALFVLLLDWRTFPAAPEDAIPVEVVASIPQPRPPVPPALPKAGSPATAAVTAAVPPPAFAAPPPEPMRAATQRVAEHPVNPDLPEPTPGKADPASAPPPEAPRVLAAESGTFAVAPVAPAAPAAAAPSHDATASAALARALPMDVAGLPASFRAVLSGGGTQPNLDYQGIVYGRIRRSHRAMEVARARHLEGQVAVIFSVDEQGRAADLKVAHSSGMPAVDALGLDMVREAEPFPPPPSTGKQIFTPTFLFGGE